MKKCNETVELLSDYLEGHLPPDEAAALEAHFGDCPPCKAFIASFKVAGQVTRQVLLSQIPQDFNSRLKTFLKTRCSKN